MRKSKFLKLKVREASFITRALISSNHPVLAHLIPMRRCNLACGYCNEYDHTSKPIDLEIVKSRLDKLADLGYFYCDDFRGRTNDASGIGSRSFITFVCVA